MKAVHALGHALSISGSMTWAILWALILGFALSAVVQAVVRRSSVAKRLGDDRPRSLAVATGFGAASSSCSYAAVALARSLFRKGASFTSAMAFEIASTNLVIELGIVLALLIGWQFTAAEFVGGPIMIVLLAVLFRLLLRQRLVDEARTQADRGLAGSMEGHAAMDMSIQQSGPLFRRLRSPQAATSISHIFVMEWAAVIRDIVIGLLIAGAVAAWVPNSFWQHLFFTSNPTLAKVWGPLIGPVVSILSFVCSIGNVPLAAVLWNGGISFGGVISFIYADLLIIPIVVIYRKYYGAKMALFIAGHVLRDHGPGRLRSRVPLRRPRAYPNPASRQSGRGDHLLELHDNPQYLVPGPSRRVDLSVRDHRRDCNAKDDGRRNRPGPRPRAPQPRSPRPPRDPGLISTGTVGQAGTSAPNHGSTLACVP